MNNILFMNIPTSHNSAFHFEDSNWASEFFQEHITRA